MPSPKRWFPVSHELPVDPKIHVMMDRHGAKFILTWLWILSRTDQTDNRCKWPEETLAAVSRSLRQSVKTVRKQVLDLLQRQWIIPLEVNENGWPTVFGTRNYRDYHRPQDLGVTRRSSLRHPFVTPSEPSDPNHPIRSEPNQEKKKIGEHLDAVDNSLPNDGDSGRGSTPSGSEKPKESAKDCVRRIGEKMTGPPEE